MSNTSIVHVVTVATYDSTDDEYEEPLVVELASVVATDPATLGNVKQWVGETLISNKMKAIFKVEGSVADE